MCLCSVKCISFENKYMNYICQKEDTLSWTTNGLLDESTYCNATSLLCWDTKFDLFSFHCVFGILDCLKFTQGNPYWYHKLIYSASWQFYIEETLNNIDLLHIRRQSCAVGIQQKPSDQSCNCLMNRSIMLIVILGNKNVLNRICVENFMFWFMDSQNIM